MSAYFVAIRIAWADYVLTGRRRDARGRSARRAIFDQTRQQARRVFGALTLFS